MRLLTPNEQRQVEQLKSFITKGYGHNDIGGWASFSQGYEDRFFINAEDNQELWLNLFEIILKKNDEMKDTWRKSSNPQI
jgi:hypothetical protein